MSFWSTVILAAGKGTRMCSSMPKILHQANGKYLIKYVIDAVEGSGKSQMVLVIGHGAERVKEALGDDCFYAIQEPQLGTGHALQIAMPEINKDCQSLLVICGDTPLITSSTLFALKEHFISTGAKATVLSAHLEEPFGYGRLIRDVQGRLMSIVEEKDATGEEKAVKEINTGTYCFDLKALKEVIFDLKSDNKQKEYYLTDIIAKLAQKGETVNSFLTADKQEMLGINDRIQLATASKVLRERKNRDLMLKGVTIVDPEHTYIESEVEVGPDTVIEPGTFLRGKTIIGENNKIGPGCDIRDSEIGNNNLIFRAMIVETKIGDECNIGPFAYLRPGTVLSKKVKIGDFVELKKSEVGEGSKIPHHSYIGDCKVGSRVNVGCGTITCNYDGYNKYMTVIEDGAFIGSNTNLVAPVKVGKNATVGAGSTITKDVMDEALAVERNTQKNIEGWSEKNRQKKQKNKN